MQQESNTSSIAPLTTSEQFSYLWLITFEKKEVCNVCVKPIISSNELPKNKQRHFLQPITHHNKHVKIFTTSQ